MLTRAQRLSIALVLAGTATLASADTIIHTGIDVNTGPGDPRPNASSARSSWDSAAALLGSTNTIDFEGMATNTLASAVILDAHTTVTRSGGIESERGIRTDGTRQIGYNTTAGGDTFLQMQPIFEIGAVVSLTFSFSSTVTAWGAFFTGMNDHDGNLAFITLNFEGGGSQSEPLFGDFDEGVRFWGFTSEDQKVTSIEIRAENVLGTVFSDAFGLDDIVYTVHDNPPIIPLPSAAVLGLAGLLPLTLRRAR